MRDVSNLPWDRIRPLFGRSFELRVVDCQKQAGGLKISGLFSVDGHERKLFAVVRDESFGEKLKQSGYEATMKVVHDNTVASVRLELKAASYTATASVINAHLDDFLEEPAFSSPQAGSGLLGVDTYQKEVLHLSRDLAWLSDALSGFARDGVYLLAGQPGVGKSLLSLQLALDVAASGKRVLYIMTEQAPSELRKRANAMTGSWASQARDTALSRIEPITEVKDVDDLPEFLRWNVLNRHARYDDCALIVVDSIQGQGLSSAATKSYKSLYDFCNKCKNNGITVLLVAHVTKSGDVAGPKTLHHNVDCIMVMRQAMSYRPLFVPKNRTGPAVLDPIPLEIDKKSTTLQPSPFKEQKAVGAKSLLLKGSSCFVVDVQANIRLPAYGQRGKLIAPGLPRKEIELMLNTLSQLPHLEMADLDYTVQCKLPGNTQFCSYLGLPLCLALIASYVRKPLPEDTAFIGEIDLGGRLLDEPNLTSERLARINSPTDAWSLMNRALGFLEEDDLPISMQNPPLAQGTDGAGIMDADSTNDDSNGMAKRCISEVPGGISRLICSSRSIGRLHVDCMRTEGYDDLYGVVKALWPDITDET